MHTHICIKIPITIFLYLYIYFFIYLCSHTHIAKAHLQLCHVSSEKLYLSFLTRKAHDSDKYERLENFFHLISL